ncbi:MAG: IspD/TarI family cytidylyltransferase [Eggerthellaceae bacterium]|nr:IspD/TarI family cytidylyltransferase [Eggerthellaceae bacterium]
MNVAIVIAGGVGSRMGQEIPKQFINVNDKPVIVYTLEAFQSHPQVDAIEVVCLDGWQDILKAYARQFGISKLKWVAKGGESGQESIRNGVYNLEGELAGDDIAIIHDGVRPMLDSDVITDVIRVCEKRGNAVSSMPYNEQIFVVSEEDESVTTEFIPRETLRRVVTPQAYRYGTLLAAYRKAFAEGIGINGSHYVNTMMVELGETLNFAAGSDKNLKLTTPENLETFRAYLALNGKGGK